MTIEEIIEINPKVGEILSRAKSIDNPNIKHYEAFKKELIANVGYACDIEVLRSYKLYDVAIIELCKALNL